MPGINGVLEVKSSNRDQDQAAGSRSQELQLELDTESAAASYEWHGLMIQPLSRYTLAPRKAEASGGDDVSLYLRGAGGDGAGEAAEPVLLHPPQKR